MSCSTTKSEYGSPTLVRTCARMRSLLTVAGPVYFTSIDFTTGGDDGVSICARAGPAPKPPQISATQSTRRRIDPLKQPISKRSRVPRRKKSSRDRRLLDGEAYHRQGMKFSQGEGGDLHRQPPAPFSSKACTSCCGDAVRIRHLE